MENKQVFDQYDRDGYDYSFCKNPGDKIDLSHPASDGVTVGYAIQHPYMFVTNSRCAEGLTGCGDDPTEVTFNYRNHWHQRADNQDFAYLQGTEIMYNAWDADATRVGFDQDECPALSFSSDKKDAYKQSNAAIVGKSVYDPCPPKFKVLPLDAFREIYKALGDIKNISITNNLWTVTCSQGTISFPSTGVRNYALRTNEWTTVTVNTGSVPGFSYKEFYKISMPAFRMLTFISTATLIDRAYPNHYQLMYFGMGKSDRAISHSPANTARYYGGSSNAYGMPVRPIKY